MRNFFLSLVAFPFFSILTACGALFGTQTEESNTGPCTAPDSTYAEYVTQEWQEMDYALPWCWSASTPSEDQLILKDGDSESQVFIHYHTPDPETLGHVREYTDTEGDTVYVEYTTQDDHETELILDSITWPNL